MRVSTVRFGVSRPTMRKAMERLRAADQIYTAPNLGSFVNAHGQAGGSTHAESSKG